MVRKSADDAVRRVLDGRKLGAQFGERLDLDLLDQMREHIVKEADLLVVITGGIAKKKIGYAPEDFRTPVARARGQNMFEFIDNGRGLRHYLSWAGFLPAAFQTAVGRPHAAAPYRVGRKA